METSILEELHCFRSAVDQPNHHPDPVVLRAVGRAITAFVKGATALGVSAGFRHAMCGLIVDAFRQLDSLPRNDPFWDGTNRRPTQFKLVSFCEKLLRDHPGNVQALQMRAAISSVVGLGFDPDTWMAVMTPGGVDITWPIGAALCGEGLGSFDTAGDLASVLTRLDRVRDALPELIRLSDETGNSYASNWAKRVMRELERVDKERDSQNSDTMAEIG